VKGRLVPRTEVTAGDRAAMFELLSSHFDGVTRRRFDIDLDEKNWVVLVTDDGGRMRGFTTFLRYRSKAQGSPVEVLVSGDTIVDPSARLNNELARSVLAAVMTLGGWGSEPIHWLLICSGFRTYRFLPVYLEDFYPRFDRATPPETLDLIRDLAYERWGEAFNPQTGVVTLDYPQVLRRPADRAGYDRRLNRHVEFFLDSNPGWVAGDELVCLAAISPENLTKSGRRVLRSITKDLESGG
jgi:hypothetical protein